MLNTLPYKFKFNEDKCKYITDNINGKYPEINVFGKTNDMKVSNRMEKNYHLSNKKALYWNLKHYCQAGNLDLYDHVPVTFHIRNHKDQEYQDFLKYFQKESLNEKLKNIWIAKPGEFSNRGKGITVCNSIQMVEEILNLKETQKNG